MMRGDIIAALARYRRPGSPMYDHHFQGLPAEIVRPENLQTLLDILGDRSLPARVREHAAGALGEIRDPSAVPPLLAALAEPAVRRGSAVALGRLRDERARSELAKSAEKCKAARWALSQLAAAGTPEAVIEDLRLGHLRLIGLKLRKLPSELRWSVRQRVAKLFEQALGREQLGLEDRWLITALAELAPEEADEAMATAVAKAFGRNPAHVCTGTRLLRAAGRIAPLQAIPALVGVICRADYPPHQQAAAVCIRKILRAHGRQARALLAPHRRRLRARLRQLKSYLADPRRRPLARTAFPEGNWPDATRRVLSAIVRLLPAMNRE